MLNPLLPTLQLYIFSSRFVAQLGLKESIFLLFSQKLYFLENRKPVLLHLCLSRILTVIYKWSETWDFSWSYFSDHCFIAYLPNTLKICLCAKTSNIVPFWMNYTFDFVLVWKCLS